MGFVTCPRGAAGAAAAEGSLHPALGAGQWANSAKSVPPDVGAAEWAKSDAAAPPDQKQAFLGSVDDGVVSPCVYCRSVLRDSHFGKTGAKLCGSLELLGTKGSLVELLGYGENLGYLRGNLVDNADGDDELIFGWRSRLEDEWKEKIAAGAA